MARILSIDYGLKRTGIAVTDEYQIIASGLQTIESKELLSFLDNYFRTEKIEKVIIGDPIQMNGLPSQSADLVNKFIVEFKNHFPEMVLEKVDERFTSKMAFQSMIDMGVKKTKRQDKALVDKIAATILLQTYLERK